MTGGQLLVVAGAVAALWYGVACWWFPFTNCWCCRGGGKHRSRSGRTFRPCRVCGGRGAYFRVGARAWHWFRGSDP